MSGTGTTTPQTRKLTPQDLKNQLGAQYFGAEIEMIVPHAQITQIIEAKTGAAATDRRKGQKEYRQKNIDTEINGRKITWGIDTDPSLNGRLEDTGELVSPKLRFDEISYLEEVVDIIASKRETEEGRYYKIDGSCSNHIHVNADDMANDKDGFENPLVRLYANYFVTQDVIHKGFAVASGREEEFCKKLSEEALSQALNANNEKDRFEAFTNTADEEDRFKSLNYVALINPGTVEFRLYNGLTRFSTQELRANAAFSVALTTASKLNVKLPPLMRIGESPQKTMDEFLTAIGLGGDEHMQTRGLITGNLSPEPQKATPEFARYYENYGKYTNGNALDGVEYSLFTKELVNDPNLALQALKDMENITSSLVPTQKERLIQRRSWSFEKYIVYNEQRLGLDLGSDALADWYLYSTGFRNVSSSIGLDNRKQYDNWLRHSRDDDINQAGVLLRSLSDECLAKVKEEYLSGEFDTQGASGQLEAEIERLEGLKRLAADMADKHTIEYIKGSNKLLCTAKGNVDTNLAKETRTQYKKEIAEYFGFPENKADQVHPTSCIKMVDEEIAWLKQQFLERTSPEKLQESKSRRQALIEEIEQERGIAPKKEAAQSEPKPTQQPQPQTKQETQPQQTQSQPASQPQPTGQPQPVPQPIPTPPPTETYDNWAKYDELMEIEELTLEELETTTKKGEVKTQTMLTPAAEKSTAKAEISFDGFMTELGAVKAQSEQDAIEETMKASLTGETAKAKSATGNKKPVKK